MTEEAAPTHPELTLRLRRAVEARAGDLTDLLARLVRVPSVNPKFLEDPAFNRESAVQDIIEKELEALGFATSRYFPLPGRPNLIGKAKGSDARSLALCGHVDVVPHGDLAQWTHAPYGAEIVGDKLFGRGSCDMKAELAASLIACRAIADAGITLEGRLEFHAVVDEEAGGTGAMAAAAATRGLAGVLIAEPSGGALRPWAGGLEWCA